MSDEIGEIEIIDNIDKAILMLKEKKTLFTVLNKEKCYFVKKKDKILVANPNSSYFLSFEEFKDLYENVHFVEYVDKEENYDFSRDDEYYSWKHK